MTFPSAERSPKLMIRVRMSGMISRPTMKINVGVINNVPCADLLSRSRFNMASPYSPAMTSVFSGNRVSHTGWPTM